MPSRPSIHESPHWCFLCFSFPPRKRNPESAPDSNEPYYQTAMTSLPLEHKVTYQKKCPMDPRHPQPGGAAHAHAECVMAPGGGVTIAGGMGTTTLRTFQCTNDYAHIWETPLPEPSSGGSTASVVQETTYAAQCDCAFTGTVDTCTAHKVKYCPKQCENGTLGKATLTSRKAYIATKPVAGHTDDCFEGHRYFVIDRDIVASDNNAATRGSPDIIPMEIASWVGPRGWLMIFLGVVVSYPSLNSWKASPSCVLLGWRCQSKMGRADRRGRLVRW